jgi:hypothetical protein
MKDFENILGVTSANLVTWTGVLTQILTPLSAFAVSVVSFCYVLYKFKNEKRKYERGESSD